MSNPQPRRRFHFGPGTAAMILGLLVFGGYTYLTQPGPAKHVYYEADGKGQMRQVERPSSVAGVPGPLWKPEPSHLMDLGETLGLSQEQRREIGTFASDWAEQKRDLESRMEHAAKAVAPNGGDRPSVASIHTDLSEYSHLSREYGHLREQAWTAAIAVLTPAQRTKLAELSKPPEVGS